ncbi:mandelate racemase/muconate lactonizing enzyme family protein [Streptomyces geranii]|uniref:mandelate racemase/muconate lactonizing enzyme family protein n=1 Tax=Streptomyces geranii TaxID=2058923 RepID=UPI0018E55E2C|nr:enolase C-terminal domain-like protein [Streptomyces geranii]
MASEARLYRVALPMRVGFDHPAARRRTSDSLVLRLTVDDVSGIGECAPRSYVTGETTDSVTEALQRVPLHALFDRLHTTPPTELAAQLRAEGFESTFPELFTHTLGTPPGTNLVCLLETAVLDLLCRQLLLPVGELLFPGAAVLDSVPVSQVLDLSIGVEEFLDTRGPFHFVKVKASDDIERDVRTVAAIRRRLGADVPVMVDANMSWTPRTAAPYARRLREAGMDLVEEPLPRRSWAALRALRQETGVRVLLDESVCTAADARAAVAAGACDAVNVRVSKNGGPVASARLIEYARTEGLGFQIGVQVAETGPLINASRALALRSPGALTVEGGQSDRFFAEADAIVAPWPVVDRRTNTIGPVEGVGFGLRLTDQAVRWTALSWADGRSWLRVASGGGKRFDRGPVGVDRAVPRAP